MPRIKTDEKYNIFWKDENRKSFGEISDNYKLPYNRLGVVLREIPSNSDVLDIGCGKGELGYYMKKEKKCDVTGIDVSDHALTVAKDRGLNVLLCDLNNPALPFKNEKFDVVTACDVLEHIFYPTELIDESYRVLKQNGLLILTLPNICYWKSRVMLIFGKLHYFFDGNYTKDRNIFTTHYHCFNKERALGMFDNRFELKSFKGVGRVGRISPTFGGQFVIVVKKI